MKKKPATPRRKKSTAPKIDTQALIDALQSHVLGIDKKRKLAATQVTAALALLKMADILKPQKAGTTRHEDVLKELE